MIKANFPPMRISKRKEWEHKQCLSIVEIFIILIVFLCLLTIS